MWELVWANLPLILGTIVWLVMLEGLLSADNALVLAVMVQHLPPNDQKRALRYGIWGAFIFRAIAVIFAYQLIQFWQLKLLGGLYLVFIAVKHFWGGGGDHADGEGKPRRRAGLCMTVVNVELADIAFSIDSILAAVALVEGLPEKLQQNTGIALTIIYVGGVLGIVMMRLVAGFFLVLLNRYQGLAAGAYVLVGWIGLKLVGSGIHSAVHSKGLADRVPAWIRHIPWELPDWAFWVGMALIVIVSVLYKPSRKASREEQTDGQGSAQ